MCKSRIAAKLILILTASLLAQGCVGVFVGRTRTETFNTPHIGSGAATYAVSDASGSGDKRTKAWLQDNWGKPTNIRPVAPEIQGELWTYKFGPVWYGVVPCVIVPIPLVLPLARQKVVFLVREGEVVSADVDKGDFSGMGASLASIAWQHSYPSFRVGR
jgi:hypothetical protein